MVNIEIYINDVLTDNAKNLSIRMNRQLINPAELNTKDAQWSFSIDLPPTPNNHKALNFANVEETKNKFTRIYKAQVVINSVRIFIGNFRLSESSAKGYKGNLYIPAVKSIKDIFGDLPLNTLPEYRIPFADFPTSVSAINVAALSVPQMAIFPYVLYGLMPKVPLDRNANNFSARDLWDSSVRIKMQDVPPSINPLLMLKHLFNSQGFELQGSAFNDAKLVQLYESYRNPADYVQPWNYGRHGIMELSGSWSSRYNRRTGGNEQFEAGVNQTSDRGYNIYSSDLFDATNVRINITQDPGSNILYKEVNDTSGTTWAQTQIRVPATGYYKVRFSTAINVFNNANWRATDPRTGVQHVSGDGDKHLNHMGYRVYEVKLLRDRKTGDFGLSNAKLDGGFYEFNQPQNGNFDTVNIPKYFPQIPSTGQINFIDQVQNRKYLLGMGYGSRDFVNNFIPLAPNPDNMFLNPRDKALGRLCQIGVAKPGLSWDSSEPTVNRIGLNNPLGYWKYGRLGSFDNEGDNPDEDIDYSAGIRVNGKVLDFEGNPQDPDPTDLDVVSSDYFISNLTGFQVSDDLDVYESSDFIDLRNFNNLKFSAEVDASPDVAVLAYYDVNKMFIGAGIVAPSSGTETFTNSPITYPALAVYIRMSGNDGTLQITGDDVTDNNIILHRFSLQTNFTYVIDANNVNYQGILYVHDGTNISPTLVAQFVDGVATFSTSGLAFAVGPKLTIYLRNTFADVDGTLTIDRTIDANSGDVVGWEVTNKYKIDILNSPDNYVYRNNNWSGNGSVSAVVWLEAGELITVASVSEEGLYRRDGMHTTAGWTNLEVDFALTLTPFRIEDEWLKVDFKGHGTEVMNWSDPVTFDLNSINLVGFLPGDTKANDYIENFVKAFNLKLTQISPTAFALDVKQSKAAVTYLSVNLDGVASITDRLNTPLGLPSKYKIGFTINPDEEGYFMTNDDGGGEFDTGSIEDTVVEQKSNFSFNWFKNITKVETGGNIVIQLPVISKHEAWVASTSYSEAMTKRYTDLPKRFWYMDGILPGTYKVNNVNVQFAKVSNVLPSGESILSYKNQPKTILNNYFTLIGIGSESHYTEAEAYLTPIQYNKLDGSHMVTFNGDQYYAAELEGYDPTNKNKTKLKLIRKI